jgi:DNA-directed RNA polymerase specialized sigma24 family protein
MFTHEFISEFDKLTEKLDRYFHKKIKESKFRGNIEEIKKDLLQDTAFAVLEKLQMPKNEEYDLRALI